jgi:L-fuconolactonase
VNPRPQRVIDAHIHLWDPARLDWYPYLARSAPRMARRFDLTTYRLEAAGWNVTAVVNVAAATGAYSVEETLELDRLADQNGGPQAIIGGLPPAATPREEVGFIERQQSAPRFRGVRPMGGLDRPVPPPEVLRVLSERSLVFELMAHPDRLVEAARQLEAFPELTVVVEHTGWPRSADPGERRLWEVGMRALAGAGPQVHCKLSGLAMAFSSVSYDSLASWLESALAHFGVPRCFFASNFPVDSVSGTFDQLYETFTRVAAGFGPADIDRLFAANAARIYRIGEA